MEWFELHAKLPHHHKTVDLAEQLDTDVAGAVGHLVMLWSWCFLYCKDGDLTELKERAVARACGWYGDPATFIKGMVEAGWLDRKGDRLLVHDWQEYGGKRLSQAYKTRETDRERQRRWRESKGLSTPAQPAQPKAQPAQPAPKRKAQREAKVYPPVVHELCAHLAKAIHGYCGEAPKVNDAWLTHMDRLLRLDERRPDDVTALIDWAFGGADQFWPPNLLAPEKLRKHWLRLRTQMTRQAKVVTLPTVAGAQPARTAPKRVSQMTTEDKDAERVRARQLAEGLGILQ